MKERPPNMQQASLEPSGPKYTALVMVDEFRVWAPGGPACFRKGSSHLTCSDVDKLHAFAIRIGLKPEWFQPHPVHPHYDLTMRRRDAALENGAVFIPSREQARRRLLLGKDAS